MRIADVILDVAGSGSSFVVTHKGRPVGRSYTKSENAWAGMAALERELICRTRPCLRCRAPFASEGAHNRLCDRCRAAD